MDIDSQNQQPIATAQTGGPQSVTPVIQTVMTANQPPKPTLNLSNSEAQALLTINNLQAAQQPKTHRPHSKLLILAVALIVVAVVVSFLVGAYKPGGSKSPSSTFGLPNQSEPTSGSETSSQINQDVKSCSNPLNAVTSC
jgi:hypothetical protein